MKRFIVLLSIALLFITGCSVVSLDQGDFQKNLDLLLSKKTKLYNVQYDGYRYYLPKGIVFIKKDEYNAILGDSHNNIYYMYVDAISYYHKVENTYKKNSSSSYSEKLDYNNKNGYIQIDEYPDENKYFIQFVFHYVKMEAYVSKEDLVDAINYMCYILRSVKYNDSILESLIGENVLDYQEEEFSLFKADSSKESYMDVVKRSESEEYNRYLEDEKIELNY